MGASTEKQMDRGDRVLDEVAEQGFRAGQEVGRGRVMEFTGYRVDGLAGFFVVLRKFFVWVAKVQCLIC